MEVHNVLKICVCFHAEITLFSEAQTNYTGHIHVVNS